VPKYIVAFSIISDSTGGGGWDRPPVGKLKSWGKVVA